MSESRVDYPVRIFFFAAASMVFFSAMNVCVKLASEDYTIVQMMFFRCAMGLVPLLCMIAHSGKWGLLRTQNYMGHFARCFVGIAAMICFFLSFAMLPITNATAIHFASPLILTMLSVPMLGERVGKPRWIAAIIGLCAVLFMLEPGDGDGNLVGSLTALVAAFLGAFAMVFVRKLGRTEHALTIVFYFTLCGMVLSAVAAAFMWNPLQAGSVIYLLAMGLFGGVAQILLTYAYAHAPAAYVAPFSYLAMVFAVLSDVLIWGVWPDWHIYAGSAVIVASGLFIVYREAKRNALAPSRTDVYGLQPVAPTKADEEDKNI